VILPERVKDVFAPEAEAARVERGEVTFAEALGCDAEYWEPFAEQTSEKLATTEAVFIAPCTGATEWSTTMVVVGPTQKISYVAMKWRVPWAKGPATFVTASVEQSERNADLLAYGARSGREPLLMQRRSGVVG
jgi:hypothetical protein